MQPKKLFLIDGLGALVSAFMLGIVLVRLESYIGIPKSSLYILAAIPIFFAAYDLYSYKKEKAHQGRLLRGIAILNLCYCFISIGFAMYHYLTITTLGKIYVVVELLIIIAIVYVELKVANTLNEKSEAA